MIRYAGVIIEFATVSEIDRPFTYCVPEALSSQIRPGQRVKIPFGRGGKCQTGYVISLMEEIPPQPYQLKAIREIIDKEPLIDEQQWQIIRFMTAYYGSSVAAAIDTVLPPGIKDMPLTEENMVVRMPVLNKDLLKVRVYYEANKNNQRFAKQKYLIDCLRSCEGVTLEELKASPLFSSSSLKTLQEKDIVHIEEKVVPFVPDPVCDAAFKVPDAQQQKAIAHMEQLIAADTYRTVLLYGVTGSGKTEVFLHVIRRIVEAGGSALVLVPEIALTSQTLIRFTQRFGNRVALTHSRMSAKERQRIYMRARTGELSIVIGPRSAVFMPLQNLKLIVIDEAHDSSYKSETPPKYHAIDIATERMKYDKGQVLLATATPDMETYLKASEGQYDLIRLPQRTGGAAMPDVHIVDMRLELAGGNTSVLSKRLYDAIDKTLKEDKQVMLLINRRGYATFVNCRSCGYVLKCQHCDVALTYHAQANNLQCHYCGRVEPVPEVCPSCGSRHIRFFGSGTEKIEAVINEHFGKYGVGRMDTDTTTGKNGHQKILDAFRRKEIRILIGTQMIAKGHDFPEVTLVGVLSADASLFMQDFRSNERTYQLLTQAMGRAGRGKSRGQVIIQTYNPDHFVMDVIKNNKQDYFYQQELANRKAMGYPPYAHIFTVLITGGDEGQVIRISNLLAQYFRFYSEKGQNHFRVIGPTSSVITKIGDEYRWRLLILGTFRDKLLIYGRFCLDKFYKKEQISGVKISWDIDPLTMV